MEEGLLMTGKLSEDEESLPRGHMGVSQWFISSRGWQWFAAITLWQLFNGWSSTVRSDPKAVSLGS